MISTTKAELEDNPHTQKARAMRGAEVTLVRGNVWTAASERLG